MTKIAAVIGCGRAQEGKEGWSIGHMHARGILEGLPYAQLCGVDISEENLAAFGEAFDVPKERLFNSTEALYATLTPDIVGISTWPGLHCDQVLEACKHGVKGILCEKPFAIDGGQMDRMLFECRSKKVKLAIAHQRRHEPIFEKAKELIESGKLGEKLVIHARVGENWDILSWTTHWFDMANYLFGEPAQSVLAGIDHTGERRYNHAIENASVIFAQYSGSRQAIFTTGPDALSRFGVSIEGEKGFCRFAGDTVEVYTSEGYEQLPGFKEGALNTHGIIYGEIAAAIETGSPIRCAAEDTAWGSRMAFAAYQSATTQRTVELVDMVKHHPLEVLQHPVEPATPTAAPRRVTLVAGRHHPDPISNRTTRDGLAAAIEAIGDIPHVVHIDERELRPQDVDGADILMICHTKLTSSEETRQIVSDWIEASKPTAIIHCGISAWSEWQAFREWSGRYWVWPAERVPADAGKQASGHPFRPCTISVNRPDAFDTGWSEAWLPEDEVYINLAEGDPIDLFATTELNGETLPIAWANQKRPNIRVFLPGHRADVWTLPVMHDCLKAICRF